MNIGLKKIVANHLNTDDLSSHQFLRLYNIAKWGLETEFNLDVTGTFKTVLLPILPNKTVELPCDYIQYSKIGQINSRGEVLTYKRNSQLSTLNTNPFNRTKGIISSTTVDGYGYPYDNDYYHNYYFNGASYRLFGADSGTATYGEYKVDNGQKLIFLDPRNSQQEILLEYLSNGYVEEDGDFVIDIRAAEAMSLYMKWKDAAGQRKKYGRNEVMSMRSEYYNAKRLTKMRMNPFILNELQDVARSGNKLVAKS